MPLETILASWGLPAVAAGTFIEGDTVAMIGGVLAHRGIVSLPGAALAASAGAFAIDSTMFLAGRYARKTRIVARQLARPSAQSVVARIKRHPHLACFLVRFAYGFNTIGMLTIGSSGMRTPVFLAIDVLACLVWGSVMTGLGYGTGTLIGQVLGRVPIQQHLIATGAAIAALLLLIWVIDRLYFRKSRSRGHVKDSGP